MPQAKLLAPQAIFFAPQAAFFSAAGKKSAPQADLFERRRQLPRRGTGTGCASCLLRITTLGVCTGGVVLPGDGDGLHFSSLIDYYSVEGGVGTSLY